MVISQLKFLPCWPDRKGAFQAVRDFEWWFHGGGNQILTQGGIAGKELRAINYQDVIISRSLEFPGQKPCIHCV
jgi:hypothetical protein